MHTVSSQMQISTTVLKANRFLYYRGTEGVSVKPYKRRFLKNCNKCPQVQSHFSTLGHSQ